MKSHLNLMSWRSATEFSNPIFWSRSICIEKTAFYLRYPQNFRNDNPHHWLIVDELYKNISYTVWRLFSPYWSKTRDGRTEWQPGRQSPPMRGNSGRTTIAWCFEKISKQHDNKNMNHFCKWQHLFSLGCVECRCNLAVCVLWPAESVELERRSLYCILQLPTLWYNSPIHWNFSHLKENED